MKQRVGASSWASMRVGVVQPHLAAQQGNPKTVEDDGGQGRQMGREVPAFLRETWAANLVGGSAESRAGHAFGRHVFVPFPICVTKAATASTCP